MSKSLTAFVATKGQELAIDDNRMADALTETVGDTSTGNQGITYLNFSGKLGRYSLGKDKENVGPEQVFLLEPLSVFRGWQCWKNSKPVDKFKWSVYAPDNAVDESDLPDHGPYRQTHGEGWKKMVGFGVVDLDDGRQIEFSTDSVSGRNAVSALLDEISQRARSGDPTIPLVKFQSEEFIAQEQKNYKPKLEVEVWVTREQAVAAFSDDVPYTVDDLLEGKKLTAAQKKKVAA
jgi:hypothetical protein